MGVLLVVIGNLLAVYAPVIVRDGIDFLANSMSSRDKLAAGQTVVTMEQPTSFQNIAYWFGGKAQDVMVTENNFSTVVK